MEEIGKNKNLICVRKLDIVEIDTRNYQRDIGRQVGWVNWLV